MKKLFVIMFLSVLIVTGCDMKKLKEKIQDTIDNPPAKSIPIMQFDKYKDFVIDKVTSLNILKYTEGVLDEEKVIDLYRIKNIFNSISKYNVLGETQRACDDNTTIYQFVMSDGNKVSFEFECDWLVLGSKRYEIERGK